MKHVPKRNIKNSPKFIQILKFPSTGSCAGCDFFQV